jgi:hypothetical protein
MPHFLVGYHITLVQHLAPILYLFWNLALLVPMFNLVALEARVVCVLDRFTKSVKVVQRGDESL